MNRTDSPVQLNPAKDEDALFEELRQEIHMVKFPEEMKKKPKKKKTVTTIVMPDGKRVKQRKDGEDDDDTPLELTLLGSSKKGDVFRRADGKRVRLVKKKDKKKRKKEEKKGFKEEIARLRVEAQIREEREAIEGKNTSLDKESDSESVESGFTAETFDETITVSSQSVNSAGWDSPEPNTKTERVEWDLQAVPEVPTMEPVSTEVQQTEEEDEEESIQDTAAQYVKQLVLASEEEQDLDGPTLHSSNSSKVFPTETPNQGLLQDTDDEEDEEEDILPFGQKEGDWECSSLPEKRSEEPTGQSLWESFSSLPTEVEEEEPTERLSSVERMRLKSMKAMAQAERLKRLSEFAKDMADMKAEWFRDVNRPRHPTQAPRGPAFTRTTSQAPKGPAFMRTNTL